MSPGTRTFEWADPAANAALLDMEGMEVEEGRVIVYLVPQEFHYNPLGSEARLTDAGGRLTAHATSTCLLFDTTGH